MPVNDGKTFHALRDAALMEHSGVAPPGALVLPNDMVVLVKMQLAVEIATVWMTPESNILGVVACSLLYVAQQCGVNPETTPCHQCCTSPALSYTFVRVCGCCSATTVKDLQCRRVAYQVLTAIAVVLSVPAAVAMVLFFMALWGVFAAIILGVLALLALFVRCAALASICKTDFAAFVRARTEQVERGGVAAAVQGGEAQQKPTAVPV